MEEEGTKHKARVIAVGNQKGGVGKSTLTVHLAAALGELGRKCLVWDLDMNRGSSILLGIPKEMHVLGSYEVLAGEEDPQDVIIAEGDIEEFELPKNVSLISARRNLEDIDAELAKKNKFGNPKDTLIPLVNSLRGDYDYIFLDTAPNLTLPTAAAYKATDYFLLSAIPEPLAVEGLATALEDIGFVKKQGNPSLRLIGVVLSAIKGRKTRLQQRLISYVQENFNSSADPFIQSYKANIGATTYVGEAQDSGKTMFQLFPVHKVTDQYREVARELEMRINAIEAGETTFHWEAEMNEGVVNG